MTIVFLFLVCPDKMTRIRESKKLIETVSGQPSLFKMKILAVKKTCNVNAVEAIINAPFEHV